MLIDHPSLAVRHGFFGRKGGVSTGVYDSLNCRAKQPESAENRRRVCAALGADLSALRILNQKHTNTVITLTDESQLPDTLEGDALVTNVRSLVLGVVTADCAPVLLADTKAGVIAAVHSGWRGTAGNIVGGTVQAMCALGAQPHNITAVIGPCIAPESYEVGPEVREAMLAMGPAHATFFSHPRASGNDAKYYFNLPALILQQLTSAGVKRAHWTGQDTYALENDYFSCRRATHRGEPDFGLQLSAITLTK